MDNITITHPLPRRVLSIYMCSALPLPLPLPLPLLVRCACSCSCANLCLPRSLLRVHARTIMLLGCRGCPALHHLPNATCFIDGGIWVEVRGLKLNDREQI